MDNVLKNEKVPMINTGGNVRYVSNTLVPELKAMGWHIVVNPKREYYPELDQANKNNLLGVIDVTEDVNQNNALVYDEV